MQINDSIDENQTLLNPNHHPSSTTILRRSNRGLVYCTIFTCIIFILFSFIGGITWQYGILRLVNNHGELVTITGACSTFTKDVMIGVITLYTRTKVNDVECRYVTADKAINMVAQGGVDFAVVESLPPDDFLNQYDLQVVPFIVGGLNMIANVPSVSEINIDVPSIIDLYSGTYQKLSDLRSLNPSWNYTSDVNLTVFHRSSVSGGKVSQNCYGEERIFPQMLCNLYRPPPSWLSCSSPNPVQWSTDLQTLISSEGTMLDNVQDTKNSFGYVNVGASVQFPKEVNVVSIQTNLTHTTRGSLEGLQAWLDALDVNITGPSRSVRSLGSCGDCWPLSVLSYVLYQKSLLQGHPRIYRGNVSACDLGESHKTNRDVTFDESPGNCTRGNALSTFLQWMYDENTEDVKRQHSFIGMSNEKGSDIAKHIHIQSYPCMGHNVPYWIPFLVGPATGLLFAISTVIIILLLIRKKSVRDSLFKNEATRKSQDNSNENSAMRRIRLETVVVRNDEELVLGEAIGKGTFSEVYSGTWKKMTVAVKKISNDTKKIKTEWLEREISLMSSLRHPNIVLFLFATVQPHYIYIVTELCSRGSLYDIIHDGSEMDLMLQMRLATDAARGMLHLHSMEPKIIHRDLKSSNLLVDKDWNLKVSDFGISVALDSQRMLTGNCGTVEYMAPECLMNTVYTEKCDVYSYGVVLAELFNRQDLYPDMSVVQIRFQVRTQQLRPSVEGIPIPIRELIENCWQTEPNLRPSFDTIVSVLTEVVQSPQLLHTRTNAMKRKTKNYAKSVPRFM